MPMIMEIDFDPGLDTGVSTAPEILAARDNPGRWVKCDTVRSHTLRQAIQVINDFDGLPTRWHLVVTIEFETYLRYTEAS